MNVACVLFVLYALCIIHDAGCAKILVLVPTPSYSHQIPHRRLLIELHKRGHEIVYFTANPIPDMNSKNFTQVDLGGNYENMKAMNFIQYRFDGSTWLEFLENYLFDLCDILSENVLNSTEMQRLSAPDSDAKFDLVMAEFVYLPAIYSIAHRFNAPLIGLSSLGLIGLHEYALGGFVLPSHEYTWEMEANTGSNVPFWQRLRNYVLMWRTMYKIFSVLMPRHQRMAEHYLGMKLPPIIDILKNTSLVFVNEADPFTIARPRLPNMITFTAFHVNDNPPPTPKDLLRFMDEAKEGFIYFSLGSNARSVDMPMEVQRIFFDVFAKLPYRIVWKYEGDIPVKLDNVYTGKWFPQQNILAHPNIKLFIYQAGLQSTEEAINFAVPLIAFPVLADQDYLSERVVATGVGKRLQITSFTREQLDSAIREIINDKEYKRRMIHLRDLIRDTPYNLVDNLVWWTEYVIRHNGAPHLRSTLATQPWYQRYDIDVVMFLTIVACVIASMSVNLVAKLVLYLCRPLRNSAGQKQKIS